MNSSQTQAKPTAITLFDPALFTRKLLGPALWAAVLKLSPRAQLRNPVMFVVYVGSIATTLLWVQALRGQGEAPAAFIFAVAAWLWVTLLFANVAEALAEGRSKAQAASLRALKKQVVARKLLAPRRDAQVNLMPADELHKGEIYLVKAGEFVPADGEVIEGIASVDESAITGESAPAIRASGGDFATLTGGTRVISDWLIARVTAEPGEAFVDRMIAMVEGATRQKTPSEVALTILLVALTLVFLIACATLLPFSLHAVAAAGAGTAITLTALIALLVCLIPTTIGGLLSAIGIAGMGQLLQANVVATSGRAVEAAGDVDVLLLDKTGTITHGNRQATRLVAAPGCGELQLAEAAILASCADETPEGRSIVTLARTQHGCPEVDLARMGGVAVPFTAQTRMSGVDLPGRQLRKGAFDAIRALVESAGGQVPQRIAQQVDEIARRGSTPLLVCEVVPEEGDAERAGATSPRVLGIVELKDVVKHGIRERFAALREMGIRTVMITGDNPLTAAAIAAEAGVDDFLAEATPEAKLATIRAHQARGRLVAMMGDGTNDAPALAQADVAVAMNSGTQAAKEASNMVDLDSDPTKLLEIVAIGKRMLMTRGALTTFSIANDIAKYFAIIPAVFVTTYPQLGALDVMALHSPASALLSAVIFNALIIVLLIPLALRGVSYRPLGAAVLLRRNLLVYGLGGIVVPFLGIKVIDIALVASGLAP